MSVDVVLGENLEQSGSYVVAALRLFERYGDAEAIVAGERRISFAGLRAQVLDLAATLQDRGIGAGTGVLVMAGNAPELPALQLALHLLGCRGRCGSRRSPPAGRSTGSPRSPTPTRSSTTRTAPGISCRGAPRGRLAYR